MIYSVRGKITVKELNLAVIECAGVGYACRTTYTTISKIGEIGSECLLYTYLYIREDMAELFGFSTQQELNCFKMLISVSGVGPKAALAILSDVTPEKFAMLVASGDSKLFTKTKGIGAKIAQRIVLELKDKIAKDSGLKTDFADIPSVASVQESTSLSEALEALMVLGYTQGEVMPILAKTDQTLSTQDLIKEVLKAMSKK